MPRPLPEPRDGYLICAFCKRQTPEDEGGHWADCFVVHFASLMSGGILELLERGWVIDPPPGNGEGGQ